MQNLLGSASSSSSGGARQLRRSFLPTSASSPVSDLGSQSLALHLPSLLFNQRKVTSIQFSALRPLWVLVAYSPVDRPTEGVVSNGGDAQSQWVKMKGLLCYWNLTRPSTPDKIMCCDGNPLRCVLPPDNSHLCLAGLEEGSVVLWDVREDDHNHRTIRSQPPATNSLLIRSASFATDISAGHTSPIVALLALQNPTLSGDKMLQLSGSRSNTFQLASLDQNLTLIIWTVIELKEGSLAGSKQDLGLGLGARVKMMKSVVRSIS